VAQINTALELPEILRARNNRLEHFDKNDILETNDFRDPTGKTVS
jgi:hypothetical protein